MSQKGPQQGDPLGPMLFCNTVHPLLTSVGSDLRLGDMDDVTLGGSQDAVARDVQTVMEVGHEVGLDLNIPSANLSHILVVSSLILPYSHFCSFQCQMQNFWVLHCFLVLFLTQRCDDLARAVDC